MATREDVIARLSSAERARTIIAAGTHVGWPLDDETILAPYLDIAGCPVLMVDVETSARLLSVGAVDMQMSAAPSLGVALLSGWLQPVFPAQLDDRHRLLLEARHECTGPGCSRPAPALVRVVVNSVRVGVPGQPLHTVTAAEYGAAAPDPIIAEGCVVAEHLNAEHVNDMIGLAARLTAVDPSEIIGAAIEWIDEFGLDLAVVDADGSETLRAPFAQPLSSISDLGLQLHQLTYAPPS